MILFDTCTLLWLASDQARLSEHAVELIRAKAGGLFVSAITAFEIGIKHRKGRLELPMSPGDFYARCLVLLGLKEIPVSGRIAVCSTGLPPIHADPADRIIIATAQEGNLTILTPDSTIRAYPETRVSW